MNLKINKSCHGFLSTYKNSNNSSKPPSTDQKRNSVDKPRKKRKTRKGISRPFFSKEQIDKRVECSLDKCPHCGISFHRRDIFGYLKERRR